MVMLRMATQKCFLLFLKLQSWFLLAVSRFLKMSQDVAKKWVLFCAAGQIFLLTLGKLLPNDISQLSAGWRKIVCLDKIQVRLKKLKKWPCQHDDNILHSLPSSLQLILKLQEKLISFGCLYLRKRTKMLQNMGVVLRCWSNVTIGKILPDIIFQFTMNWWKRVRTYVMDRRQEKSGHLNEKL